ncbi:MAG: hypothetical protein WC387_01505 [Candidatus Paceibacterota bacterium]|jgi:hypothetical protein
MDTIEKYDFSEDEISAVRNRFPKLTLKERGVWEGEIEINAVYNEYLIQDSFEIQIIANNLYPDEMPVLMEIGGRTEDIADKYQLKDKRSLHYNSVTKVACLCVKPREKQYFPTGSNLVIFINDLVTPYLYGLSYFDKNGRWPWGEYGHGIMGLLECYAENSIVKDSASIENLIKTIRREPNWKEYNIQLRKPNSKKNCLCGLGDRSFEKCHSLAWEGLKELQQDVLSFGLNPNKLFQIVGGKK